MVPFFLYLFSRIHQGFDFCIDTSLRVCLVFFLFFSSCFCFQIFCLLFLSSVFFLFLFLPFPFYFVNFRATFVTFSVNVFICFVILYFFFLLLFLFSFSISLSLMNCMDPRSSGNYSRRQPINQRKYYFAVPNCRFGLS